MTYYETWSLPQYVLDHFGKPLTLKRTAPGTFWFCGPKKNMGFEASSASSARQKVREYVIKRTETNDKRITRHRDGPVEFKSRRTT